MSETYLEEKVPVAKVEVKEVETAKAEEPAKVDEPQEVAVAKDEEMKDAGAGPVAETKETKPDGEAQMNAVEEDKMEVGEDKVPTESNGAEQKAEDKDNAKDGEGEQVAGEAKADSQKDEDMPDADQGEVGKSQIAAENTQAERSGDGIKEVPPPPPPMKRDVMKGVLITREEVKSSTQSESKGDKSSQFVVYDTQQVRLKYLVEVTSKSWLKN